MDKQFLTQVTQRISGLAFGSMLAVSAVFLAVSPTAAFASATENAAQAPIQQELAPFVADYVAYRHGDDVGYARAPLRALRKIFCNNKLYVVGQRQVFCKRHPSMMSPTK